MLINLGLFFQLCIGMVYWQTEMGRWFVGKFINRKTNVYLTVTVI